MFNNLVDFEKSKDFSTRNYNKDFQQGFATRKCSNKNVPTKMFHQKCTNKNVPTKISNKNPRIFQQGFFNITTRIYQQKCSNKIANKNFQQGFSTRQGFFNKDLQQGIKDCWNFQQGFFNKILVEKSLLKNPCWKFLVKNPC